MQVACNMATWHCEVMDNLLSLVATFVNLKVGGSNPLFWQYFHHGCFFITPWSCIVFCKTLYHKEMARIYLSNQKIQNAKFSTFWRFLPKAQSTWREPCSSAILFNRFDSVVLNYCYSLFTTETCSLVWDLFNLSQHTKPLPCLFLRCWLTEQTYLVRCQDDHRSYENPWCLRHMIFCLWVPFSYYVIKTRRTCNAEYQHKHIS